MGVIIRNGILYGDGGSGGRGSDIRVCTQEEYNALLAAGTDDPDVYYFITDSNESGEGGSVGYIEVLDTMAEIKANTEEDKVAGALAVKELNSNIEDKIFSGETWVGVKSTNDTTKERIRLHGHKSSSSASPVITLEHYNENSTAVEDKLSIYYDGTDFKIEGVKDGSTSKTLKIGTAMERLTSSITSYSSLTLAAALTQVFTNDKTTYGSYAVQVQTSEGWFHVNGFRASNAAYGIATLNGSALTVYSFQVSSISGGADAVLKKLGEPEIKSTTYSLTLSGSGGRRTATKDVSSLGTIAGYGVTSVSTQYNCYDNTVDTIAASCSISNNVITVKIEKSGGDNNVLTGTSTAKLTVWYY